jgi:hypothetical protein
MNIINTIRFGRGGREVSRTDVLVYLYNRWLLECENVGADPKTGITLQHFVKLYSLHGRNAWLDTVRVFELP